jgi:hypothetical protein
MSILVGAACWLVLSDASDMQASQLHAAHEWQESIILQVFAAVAGDDRESKMERRVDVILPDLQQVRSMTVNRLLGNIVFPYLGECSVSFISY